MPSLFYTLTRTINVAATLRDASIPLITLLLITNWSNVNISLLSTVAAIIIAFIGSLSFYLILFWCSLPSIKIGEGEALVDLGVWFGFETINAVPYEGFDQFPFSKTITLFPFWYLQDFHPLSYYKKPPGYLYYYGPSSALSWFL
jgi:hypothetical protein